MWSTAFSLPLFIGASFAAQSTPTVVCVAGQCLQGLTNTTSAFSGDLAAFISDNLQSARRCRPLAHRPAFSSYLDSTRPQRTPHCFTIPSPHRPHPFSRPRASTPTFPSRSISRYNPVSRRTLTHGIPARRRSPRYPVRLSTSRRSFPPDRSPSRPTFGSPFSQDRRRIASCSGTAFPTSLSSLPARHLPRYSSTSNLPHALRPVRARAFAPRPGRVRALRGSTARPVSSALQGSLELRASAAPTGVRHAMMGFPELAGASLQRSATRHRAATA